MRKKWILVVVILVLVAGLAGYIVSQGGKTPQEKAAEELFPKVEDISSAPDLKYVEPPEAEGKLQVDAQLNKEHWEQLLTLSIEVKIKNETGQMLLKVVVTHSIYDKSGKAIVKDAYGVGSEVSNVGPGEVGIANLEMLMSGPKLKEIDRVEYSLRDISFASSPTQEEPKQKEEEPARIEEPEETASPPMTPEEVVMKWYSLLKEGRFSEAEDLYTPDGKEDIEFAGGLKKVWEANPIVKLEILKTKYSEPEPNAIEAQVYVFMQSADGVTLESDGHFNFYKINNQWKIDDLYGCYPGLD